MVSREIIPGVLWVGALDFDRRIFDELIPLPNGTSYNAYLIRGSEKTALIDTVDPTKEFDLISNLVKTGLERIDYIIINHAEQDHAGSLPMVLEFFPDAKVVTNEKCRDLLIALLHIPAEKFRIIRDRETLSLGDRTLEFILTPWTHWPETQVTYLQEDRILFPCDLFGYHTATSDLYVTDQADFYIPAKRYFAEIMMPFRGSIKGHLEKIRALKIDLIAPSHGPVHKKPDLILDAYTDWVSDNVKNEVVIPYVSMHGSTERMVKHLAASLVDRGVRVELFDLAVADIGKLAMVLLDAATVVVGTCTVLAGPHPLAAYATLLANALKPRARFLAIVGSYGWGGKAVETLAGMIPNLKVEVLEPVLCKGFPREANLKALEELAATIAQKHQQEHLA